MSALTHVHSRSLPCTPTTMKHINISMLTHAYTQTHTYTKTQQYIQSPIFPSIHPSMACICCVGVNPSSGLDDSCIWCEGQAWHALAPPLCPDPSSLSEGWVSCRAKQWTGLPRGMEGISTPPAFMVRYSRPIINHKSYETCSVLY